MLSSDEIFFFTAVCVCVCVLSRLVSTMLIVMSFGGGLHGARELGTGGQLADQYILSNAKAFS